MAAIIDNVEYIEEMPVLEEMQSALEEEQLNQSMETGHLEEYLTSPGKAVQLVLNEEETLPEAIADDGDSSMLSSSNGDGVTEDQATNNHLMASTPKVGSKQWMETVFPEKDAAIAKNKLPPVQYSPTGKPVTSDHNVIVVDNGHKLMHHFDKEEKWRNIFLIKNKEGLGLNMPEQGFGIDDVIDIMGANHTVSTIDVYEQHSRDMTLEEFRALQLANEKPYNILSLEFSKTELANFVSPPDVYRMMSLAEFYWPEKTDKKTPPFRLVDPRHRDMRPRVERFCLIGMGGSFTDFHIDFGGSSVWYHVFSGKKVFYVVPPTKENLDIYQRNEITKDQFLADIYGDQCWRVEILPGQTLIIPAGWIHAVHTPEDSIVFGGNFLTLNDLAMQCEVHAMERRHTTGKSFFYPEFELVNWYAARTLAAQLKNGKTLPAHLLEGAKTLLSHLIEWKKIEKKGKKSERKYIFNDMKSTIVDKLRKALEGATDDIESVEHLMDRSIGSQPRKRRGSILHDTESKKQKLHAYVVPAEPVEHVEDVEEVEDIEDVDPVVTVKPLVSIPKDTPARASRISRGPTPKEKPVSEGRSRERRFREKEDKGSEEDLLNQLVLMSEKVSKSETKMKANEKKMRENRKKMEEMEEKMRDCEKKLEETTKFNDKEMGEETQVREKKVNEDELKMRETYEAFKEAMRLEREKNAKEMEEANAALREKEVYLEEREKKVNDAELEMEEQEREFNEKMKSKADEEENKRRLQKKEHATEMEERERLLNLKVKLRIEGAEMKLARREQALSTKEHKMNEEQKELQARERSLIHRDIKIKEDAERALSEMRAVMMEEMNRETLKVHQELKMAVEEEMKLQKMILEASMEEELKNEKAKIQELKMEIENELKREKSRLEQKLRTSMEDELKNEKLKIQQATMTSLEETITKEKSRLEQDLKTSMEEELKNEKLKIQELRTSIDEEMKREKSKIEQELKTSMEEELKNEKLKIQELRTSIDEEMKREKSKIEQELKTSMEDEVTLRISEVQEEKRALGELKERIENEASRNDSERRRLDAVKTELNDAMTSLSGLKNSLDEEKTDLEAAKKAMKDYKTGHRLAQEQRAFHARMQEEWAQLEREKARDEAERAALEEERRVIEEEWRKVEAARSESMEQEHQEEEVAVVEEIELPVNCQNKENKEIKEEVEEQETLMIEPPVQLEKKAETEREVKQEEPEESPQEANSPMINPAMVMPCRVDYNQMEEQETKDVKPLLLEEKRRRKSTKKFEPNPHQSFYEYE